jgi:TusA-related sulfurtransferase
MARRSPSGYEHGSPWTDLPAVARDAGGQHDGRAMSEVAAEPRTLDLRGLKCPLPVLKTRKQLAAMGSGARLQVLATDPRAPADMAELCAATGHRLLEEREQDGVFTFLLERC